MAILDIMMSMGGGNITPPTPKPNYDAVVIIRGQSNAVGVPPINSLFQSPFDSLIPSITREFQRVKIWNPFIMEDGGMFRKLRAPIDPQFGSVHNECYVGFGWMGFGAEIALAQRWEQENDGTLYIIKDAAGSTHIQAHLKGDSAGYYARFASYYTAASQAVSLPSTRVFYWDQGEADSGDTNYENQLIQLISDMTSDGFITSGSRIALVGKPTTADVNNAQIAYAASNPNSGVIDTSWATFINPLHYDAESLLKIAGNEGFNILFNTTGSITGL